MTEQELIRLLAARRGVRDPGGHECPTDAALAALIGGALDEPGMASVEEHVASCGLCLDLVGGLVRSSSAQAFDAVPEEWLARVQGIPSMVSFGVGVWRWAAVGSLAFGLIAAAVFLPDLLKRGSHSPSVPVLERPQENPSLRDGSSNVKLTFSSPPQSAIIDPDLDQFSWFPIAGALRYQLNIVDESGFPVWKGETRESHLKIPQEAGLKPARLYYAGVTAFLSSGRQVASEFVSFTIGED